MAERALSARMGARRRNRIAYLVLLRRVTEYAFRAHLVRVPMLLLIGAGAGLSARWPYALAMMVPALLSAYLSVGHWHAERNATEVRQWILRLYGRSVLRTDSRHKLNMGGHLDIWGGFLLVAVPSWVATDLPVLLRLLMLAAATAFLVNVAACIFNDHTFFNPGELRPPLWHEVFRFAAGLVVAVPVAAIAGPAPWPREALLSVFVIAACGLTASARIWDTDITMRYTAPLVVEESRAGRELVATEMHGALSTNLRLLEQHARAYRASDPVLYDLAVSANSRLRETLALANSDDPDGDSLETVFAPVYTLARAAGARVDRTLGLTALGEADRHLVRLVLNDLVGNALNAGAGAVRVSLGVDEGVLSVSVADDAPPIPPGVWQTPGTSSARLAERLAVLGGSLCAEPGQGGKVVSARWQAQDEVGADEQQRDPSPAR